MPERVGVIDIGSNSIRLVVYRGTGRVPVSVFNEKVLCGLARGMAEAGSLDTEGTARALASLERFAALARAMGVGTLHTVATAAVREATDGAAFVARVAERCGLDVRVLSGAEEARLSALGVVADMPAADGVVGAHATLPLGSLRLAHGCSADPAGAAALIDRELGALGWLPALSGRTFYPVGGAWRALARLHVAQIGYPLEIIDQYSVKRARLAGMLGLVSQMSARSLAQLGQVPKRRIDTLPIASLVMQRLLRVGAPTGVSFSAHGLREGLLYSHLPAARRAEDPLIAACRATAGESGRFEPLGEALFDWTAPLFGGEDARGRRLRHAACLLSDLAWPDHPQYRAEQDLLRVLRAPVLSVDHRGAGCSWHWLPSSAMAATRKRLRQTSRASCWLSRSATGPRCWAMSCASATRSRAGWRTRSRHRGWCWSRAA